MPYFICNLNLNCVKHAGEQNYFTSDLTYGFASKDQICIIVSHFCFGQKSNSTPSVSDELTYWQKTATMFSRENDKLRAELESLATSEMLSTNEVCQ